MKKFVIHFLTGLIYLFVGTVIGAGILKFDLPGSNLYSDFFEDYILEFQELVTFSSDQHVRDGFNDSANRTEVPCIDSGTKQLTILVIGQSNAANSGGESGYSAGEAVVNFNFLDGKCYRAVDPLLGATGTAGSIWTRLGDRLVSVDQDLRVTFIPIAFGGTSINRWSEDGDLNKRLLLALERARDAGLAITHVFWEQGQADARSGPAWSKRRPNKFVMYRESGDAAPWYTMRRSVYRDHFENIMRTVGAAGLSPQFLVAVSSMCGHDGSPEVTAGQQQIVEASSDVLPGPNYDAIHRRQPDLFPDDCHLSNEGLETLADAWLEAFSNARPE